MTVDPTRRAISHEVRRALSDSRLTAAAAARKMPKRKVRGKLVEVEPKTIYRWQKGEVTPPLDQLDAFGKAIGQTLALRVGKDAEIEPPPEWARALSDEIVNEIQLNREAMAAQLGEIVGQAVASALATLRLPLRDE